jgi:hypothetical protein
LRYQIRATGVTLQGDASFLILSPNFEEAESFEIDGVFALVDRILPDEAATFFSDDLPEARNLADIAVYLGDPHDDAAAAGEAVWASNAHLHVDLADLSSGAARDFYWDEALSQAYDDASRTLVTTIDPGASRVSDFDVFHWNASEPAVVQRIVEGDVTATFSDDFTRVSGTIEFRGEGQGGTFAIEASFSGRLIDGSERPDFAPASQMNLEVGGPGRDRMTGDGGRDQFDGRGGPDALFGRGGADVLFGGSGRDRLFGGSGRDDLKGGGGADLLVGGKGRDKLHGGGGPDDFRFGRGDGKGDRIRDFQPDQDEVIFTHVSGFRALKLRQKGDDLHVAGGGVKVILEDTDRSDVDRGDFAFA